MTPSPSPVDNRQSAIGNRCQISRIRVRLAAGFTDVDSRLVGCRFAGLRFAGNGEETSGGQEKGGP